MGASLQAMVEVLTAGAVALAWFVFRYDRHGRQRDAIEAAHATLSAAHHGMMEGETRGPEVGLGDLYFREDISEADALVRAEVTRDAVMAGQMTQASIAPTEPLAKVATSSPQEGLIDTNLVASASYALWRVHVFNQHVKQLTDFNSRYAVEITSEADPARRADIARGAMKLAQGIHQIGTGWAWSIRADGVRGWYRAFVDDLAKNLSDLSAARDAHRWRWLRLSEWPYSGIDLIVLASVVAVLVSAVC